MVYPVLAYGHPLLRAKGAMVDPEEKSLDPFIEGLWQTMRRANGCGLAASQAGSALQLFIIDSRSTYLQQEVAARKAGFEAGDTGIEETFINAQILNRSVQTWVDDEGCLSIPGLYQPVERPWSVEVMYTDRALKTQHRMFSGITARMIQHEYDHTQGILYLDHLSPLSRKLLGAKLKRIRNGKVHTTYPLEFYR